MKSLCLRLGLRHLIFLSLQLGILLASARASAELKRVDFMGSSTVQFWTTIQEDFPQIEPVNLGVWGSDYGDLLKEAPRYLKENPAEIFVIYSGDNDIAFADASEIGNGKAAAKILEKFSQLTTLIRAHDPESKIYVISIKPCPVADRRARIPEVKIANRLLREFAASMKNIVYVDIFDQMLTSQGEPRSELFREDGLHLNEAGYALWTKTLNPLLP